MLMVYILEGKMARAKLLANHLERTVTGPMWHGPALATVLEAVTH
jgi:hypothetical protein